jgi:hypothetical protein
MLRWACSTGSSSPTISNSCAARSELEWLCPGHRRRDRSSRPVGRPPPTSRPRDPDDDRRRRAADVVGDQLRRNARPAAADETTLRRAVAAINALGIELDSPTPAIARDAAAPRSCHSINVFAAPPKPRTSNSPAPTHDDVARVQRRRLQWRSYRVHLCRPAVSQS